MSPFADTTAPASTSAPRLAPLVATQLKFLLSNSNPPIMVERIWSGCRNGLYADRFTLAIPFCLDYVHWDFLYNAIFPKVAPDVVFGPEDQGFQPLFDYQDTRNEDNSCLAQWDCQDPRGLHALINELRLLYTEYQKKRVAEVDDARLKFEISTVLAKEQKTDTVIQMRRRLSLLPGLLPVPFPVSSLKTLRNDLFQYLCSKFKQGIEVCMVSPTGRPDEVKFAVPLLDLDFTKLVPGCPWKFPQKIHLQAVFPVSRSYPSVPPAPRLKLMSTPDLKSFFSVDGVKLPAWVDGMCMAEYIPALEEYLKIQVVDASASIGSRRRFIEALAPTFGRPLEADPIFCRRATVLSISGIFTFLVHFNIPLQFPKQQPILTLQSSQHCNSQGIPIMSPPINDYPWSPRWDSAAMVERIYDFLADECQNFKKFCSDSFPQQPK